MIHYRLVCDAGHDFDSWFRDSDSFDAQAAQGLIHCPFCQSSKISRGVMACGTGVCRGCPLPRSADARDRVLAQGAAAAALQGNPDWAMCCTDGPVFESRDLDWDRVE